MLITFGCFLRLPTRYVGKLPKVLVKNVWTYNVQTAAWLAQLGEHRSVEREVAGSSPGRTNTQGLNNN